MKQPLCQYIQYFVAHDYIQMTEITAMVQVLTDVDVSIYLFVWIVKKKNNNNKCIF